MCNLVQYQQAARNASQILTKEKSEIYPGGGHYYIFYLVGELSLRAQHNHKSNIVDKQAVYNVVMRISFGQIAKGRSPAVVD